MGLDRKHRRDVDGLRALAVLFVFLFHLDFGFASGGFVGVDIFYVISGFVIFRSIQDAPLHDRRFVLAFYLRRVRRLLPALLFTITICLMVGYVVLTPTEYVATARSGLAAVFSVSNIYFADTLSYFADGARTLPLLHTWSLGIEEQFYLVIPWALVLLARLDKRDKLFAAMAAICVLSFIYNIFSSYLGFDERHAFYMPMSRFWEIGVGALVALMEKKELSSPRFSELFSLFGAMGLGLSFLIIDPRMVFPGFTALLPVCATALLILAQPGKEALQMRILGCGPAQFFGRISYSLYLHHWLPIVLIGLLLGRDFEPHEKWLILLVTTLSAWASWRFIEVPFRDPAVMGTRAFSIALGLMLLAILSAVGAILLTKGAINRLNPAALSVHAGRHSGDEGVQCQVYEAFPQIRRAGSCAVVAASPPVDYILWGDSHAGVYARRLGADLGRAGFSGFEVEMSDCPPVLDVHFSKRKNQRECGQLADAILDWAQQGKVKILILSSRWAMLASDRRSPSEGVLPKKIYANADGAELTFEKAFDATISKLTQLGVKILIIGPSPEFHFDVPNALVRSLQLGIGMPILERRDFDARQRIVLKAFERMEREPNVAVFYPHRILCSDASCLSQVDNIPLYIDDDHLGPQGVARLTPSIVESFRKLRGG